MGRVKDKVALVTGGGTGIGKAIAERFVDEGACVVITDLDTSTVTAVAYKADRIEFVEQDVSDPTRWPQVIALVLEKYGSLDILVNNAGILATEQTQGVEDTTFEQWKAVHAVNSDGVFLGCQYAIEAMKITGGAIVNLSSVAGIFASPNFFAYGASKAVVRQITKSVAVHCGRNGYRIRCNSVHPGIIHTDMGDQVISLGNSDPDQMWAERYARIPIGNAGTVEDVANSVLFLASEEAKHITGAELVVDGGQTVDV